MGVSLEGLIIFRVMAQAIGEPDKCGTGSQVDN